MNISDAKVGDCQLPPVTVMPIAKTEAEHSIREYTMTSEETRERLEDRNMGEGDKPRLDELSEASEQGSRPATKRPGVPLRMRQLPASFWREPNRPKADLIAPISSLTLAYIGQCYKNDRFNYTDVGSPDISYRPGLHSSPSMANQNESMSDYLYRNYASKYQQSTAKSPDIPTANWNCFPGSGDKLFSHSYSGLSANPYSINLTAHRRTAVDRCGELRPYPVTRSDLLPGHWDGLSLGQYPTHSSQHTLSPWRPIASKTSPSYPARYHPFVV